MPVINRTPYRNLILTGPVGVGKTGVGRIIERELEGVQLIDIETAFERREGYTPEQIRLTFGAARLRSIETELVQEASLHRSTIIAVSGSTMLDPANRERLAETGPVLCLTADLGEILRRLHVTKGGWFHEPNNRALMIAKLKREREVTQLSFPTLDTTPLKLAEVAEQAKAFWLEHEIP